MSIDGSSEQTTAGSRAAAISTMVVRLLSEYTGRGPTRARTYISGDLVSCVLQDTLTKGERRLIEDGEERLVLDMRRQYQRAMRDDLVRGVEEITGRTVMAFLSDNHAHPDVAIESFLLAPENDGNGELR